MLGTAPAGYRWAGAYHIADRMVRWSWFFAFRGERFRLHHVPKASGPKGYRKKGKRKPPSRPSTSSPAVSREPPPKDDATRPRRPPRPRSRQSGPASIRGSGGASDG